MKKIINRKNAAAVACAAMMICAAGAVPDGVLNVSMPVQAAEAAVQTSLPQVTGLTSKTPDISSIRLSWNAVNGADGYSVGMRSKGQYPEIADVTDTTYLVTGLPAATRENFKVRAYKIVNGQKVYGDYSVNYNSATNPRPISGLKAQTGNTSVSLSWKKVGCSNYRVFMLKNGKWKQIAQTDTNSYTVIGLDAGSYKFKVRACKRDDKGANHYGKYSQEITAQAVTVNKVTGLTSKTPNTSSVKLSWNKIGNCKYRVYRYDPKKKTYKRLTVTSSTSYTDKKLSEATSYTYAVKLEYNSKTGPYITVKGNTKLSTPKMTVKAYNKKVTISWKKNKKSDGYQIYWCKGDEWTIPHNDYYSMPKDCYNDYVQLKKITKNSTTSYTKSNLSGSKNYHFKMRAYKTINGKVVYSSWTGIQCKINTVSRLNAATKKSHSTYKIYNVQGKKTKTSTHTLTAEEKKILKNFASKHFKKDWSAAKKIEYTADWIRKNLKYGRIPTGSHSKNIFVYKEGQCSDYNGALVEMMVYLGYDANLVMGNRQGGGQHFWGEIKIDGVTYLLEVGEKVYDSPQWNYKWQFMCLKYSEADGGYKKNGKLY